MVYVYYALTPIFLTVTNVPFSFGHITRYLSLYHERRLTLSILAFHYERRMNYAERSRKNVKLVTLEENVQYFTSQ